MSQNIFLLVDYRGVFYSSTRYPGAGFDIDKLKKYFSNNNFNLTIKNFRDIDFRNDSYNGEIILYQTSEDPGLHYKNYIEDIYLA